MVFSSVIFLFLFLPLVLFVYYQLPNIRSKNILLLLASLIFYSWGEAELVLLMIISCLFNYFVGLLIHKSIRKKSLMLGVGVTINILTLLYFKYFNFIIDSVNYTLPKGLEIIVGNVHLPIGISFFTFQAISYLIDVYRKDTSVQKNPMDLALYISLFPQLIAGPIVRYQTIASELKARTNSLSDISVGIHRFIVGLGKKVLIANIMGQLADNIIGMEAYQVDSLTAWVGILAYSLQIYFDFSGYSDMAIGLGRMFGFNFLENFNYPYLSKSIQEFWRRWHISLSSWFRDYLYIPLGGNRKGILRTYINLIIVFFITGLWHGASWSFVVWGLYHGMFLIVERLGFGKLLEKWKPLGSFYTLMVAMIGWVFFRIEKFDKAWDYLLNMLSFNMDSALPSVSQFMSSLDVIILIIGILMSLKSFVILQEKINNWALNNSFIGSINRFAAVLFPLLILSLSVLSIATNTYNPFIYFRF